MFSFTDDSANSVRSDVSFLKARNVQKILSTEELSRLHSSRLARFSNNQIDENRWGHLKQCDGSGCVNITCSATCTFGERRQINRLVRQAAILMRRDGRPQHFVTIVAPDYFRPAGQLDTFSVNGLFQGIRRRLRAAPANWAGALAAGAVDISYNREADGREFWTPHVHLTVAVEAERAEVDRVFKPLRDPPPEYVGRLFKPVVSKPVTNLHNALAYSMKAEVTGRRSILDGRQNVDRTGFAINVAAKLEHDLWLLGMKPRDRTFLAGMKVGRGGLALINQA